MTSSHLHMDYYCWGEAFCRPAQDGVGWVIEQGCGYDGWGYDVYIQWTKQHTLEVVFFADGHCSCNDMEDAHPLQTESPDMTFSLAEFFRLSRQFLRPQTGKPLNPQKDSLEFEMWTSLFVNVRAWRRRLIHGLRRLQTRVVLKKVLPNVLAHLVVRYL